MRQADGWSRTWKASKQASKQRKYTSLAPHHARSTFVASPLSKELKTKQKTKTARLRVGDVVKILRGQYKSRSGKVNKIDAIRTRVYVDDIGREKKDGSKALYPIHPSNVQILEFGKSDRRRFRKGKKKVSKPAVAKPAKKKAVKKAAPKKEEAPKAEEKKE